MHIVHLLTEPRTVQAVIVMLFSLLVVFLAATHQAIPEIVGFSLSAIIGYYFGDIKRTTGSPTPTTEA